MGVGESDAFHSFVSLKQNKRRMDKGGSLLKHAFCFFTFKYLGKRVKLLRSLDRLVCF